MRYHVTIGDRTVEVDLTEDPPTVDGSPVSAELVTVPGTAVRHLTVNGQSRTLTARPGDRKGRWEIVAGDARFTADAVDERTRTIREMTGADEDAADREITAPMPGMVVRVEVAEGDEVRAGQGVIVVEAMKMENELKAPADGVIASIEVEAGQAVEKGQTLLVLE